MNTKRFLILALMAAFALLIGVSAYSPVSAAPAAPTGENFDTSCGTVTGEGPAAVHHECWTEDGVHKMRHWQPGMVGSDPNKPSYDTGFDLAEAPSCKWSGDNAHMHAAPNIWFDPGYENVEFAVDARTYAVVQDPGGPNAGFDIWCSGVVGNNEPQPEPESLSFWADSEGHGVIIACMHDLEELPGHVTIESAEGAALGLLLDWEGILSGGYAAQFSVASVYTVTLHTTIPLTIIQDAVQAGWTMFESGWRRELPAPPEPPVPPQDPWTCGNPMVATRQLADGSWETMSAEYQPRADIADGKLIVGQWQIPHPSEEHGFCLMLPAGETLVKAAGSKVLLADQTVLVNHEEKTINLATPTWVFVQEDSSPDQGGVVFEGPAVYDPGLYTRGLIMAEFLPMISR